MEDVGRCEKVFFSLHLCFSPSKREKKHADSIFVLKVQSRILGFWNEHGSCFYESSPKLFHCESTFHLLANYTSAYLVCSDHSEMDGKRFLAKPDSIAFLTFFFLCLAHRLHYLLPQLEGDSL